MKIAGSGSIRGESVLGGACSPARSHVGSGHFRRQHAHHAVARLLDPHPKTFGGKIRQLWRALQLEWHLSKREILTLYLNRAPFGGTLQGIGAASWAYLGNRLRI